MDETDDSQRNHDDKLLQELVDDLDEGQVHGLRVAGLLPYETAREAPRELSGKDVARMIELAEE